MQTLGEIFKTHTQAHGKKPPAHEWQDLALHIIQELNIPNFKRNSVFKICKEKHKTIVERALSDTKELCKKGEQWKYFFKVIDGKNDGDGPVRNY